MNTMGQATLTTITAIFEEYKETLIDVIDDLTRHSYISRCQAQYLKMTKATLGGGMKSFLSRILLKITSS